jgi:hypothetical protein
MLRLSPAMGAARGGRFISIAGLIAGLLLTPFLATADPERPFGDVRVFANVPAPRNPEGIAVLQGAVYVSTPNSQLSLTPAPSLRPSRVIGFDLASAAVISSVAIQGQNLLGPNALLGMAPGSGKTLFVLERQDVLGPSTMPARVLRLDYSTSPPTQTTYASIPELPACLPGTTTGCSPTLLDLRPVPNSIAFDLDGSAYITDTGQATIWRVKPGGGTAEVWFTDRRIDAVVTGPNGGTIDTAARRFYFTTSPLPIEGVVWWLPLVATPASGDLHRFHTFNGLPVSIPDGLALGEKGVYVAFASDQAVVILDLAGNEIARIVLKARLQLNRYGITTPASLAFDGTGRVLVANVDANNPLGFGSAVFDVWVDDPGIPLVGP